MLIVRKHHARVVICYKNFGAAKGLSHIGLGVSAMQNVRMLQEAGFLAEVWPISSAADLRAKLAADRSDQHVEHHRPVTHVVISAPWLPTPELAAIANTFFDIQFAVVSHSNIGFLQADPQAIHLLREDAELEQSHTNFHVAGNSHNLVTWWQATYQTPMLHLPNMYPIADRIPHKRWSGCSLRIGCFCAVRPYKNILTAAAAALEIGVRLRVSDLEFWMSGGRTEGAGQTIDNAIREMYSGMRRARVVKNSWESWPRFTTTVGEMDLLLQPSYTEGFNMVTADGISRGIASVTSTAIDWVPDNWQANSDSASDIANHGISLLHDPNAAEHGADALRRHNMIGLESWKRWLSVLIG